MNGTAHTKGPWFWSGLSLMASRKDHSETVLVTKDWPFTPKPTVARLIAAAPDMLAALEPFSTIAGEYFAQNLNRDDIVASIKRPDGTRLDITAGHLFDARAAISKATAEHKGEGL